MGSNQIQLVDNYDKSNPEEAYELFSEFYNNRKGHLMGKLAVQFSDSYRKAIPNLIIALLNEIKVIDTSTAGAGY